MKIILVANTSWYLYNFRMTLMMALRERGCEVIAVAPTDAYSAKLVEAGIPHLHVPLRLTGLNPFRELASVLALHRLFRAVEADAVLSFTPKGNVYSGLAIGNAPLIFIANISGLGRAFAQGSLLQPVASVLFKRALAQATAAFFQNRDDLRTFVDRDLVVAAKAVHIPGSGVNLMRFTPQNNQGPSDTKALVFLLIARLIWAKGIKHYVEAARILKARNPKLRFQLLGSVEQGGRGVSKKDLENWKNEGLIEYLGFCDDVRPYIARCDCIVLPSYYREGVPRSLLEGSAMEKPIITTDMPGCRDAVDDGISGFLCRAESTEDLVEKIQSFTGLNAESRRNMGRKARAKMEREFDEQIVINRYLDITVGGTGDVKRTV